MALFTGNIHDEAIPSPKARCAMRLGGTCLAVGGIALFLFSVPSAEGRNWKDVPQPVVAGPPGGRYALLADARSGLAFHSNWSILFNTRSGQINGHYWNGRFFDQLRIDGGYYGASVKEESALVVDEKWSHVYFISPQDKLRYLRYTSQGWAAEDTVEEPLTDVLGVDAVWHIVYAYSALRKAIVAVRWYAPDRRWWVEPLVYQVGWPGGEGVVDSRNHILYTTHATLNQTEAQRRVPLAHGNGPVAGLEWPLLATWWDGARWQCRRLMNTGVPQRPAWDAVRKRLCFARWNGTVDWIQMHHPRAALERDKQALLPGVQAPRPVPRDLARLNTFPDVLGPVRWRDDQSYPVDYRVRDYFNGAGLYLFFYALDISAYSDLFLATPPPVPATWEKVQCYLPDWVPTPTPPRVSSWAGLVSPRRGELISQSAKAQSGEIHSAAVWREVPNIYRTSIGVYFRWVEGWEETLVPASIREIVPSSVFPGSFATVYRSLETDEVVETFDGRSLPRADLISSAGANHYFPGGLYPHASYGLRRLLSTDVVLAHTVPLPPARMVNPATLTTFGMPLTSSRQTPRAGARELEFSETQGDYCWSGGIAADRRSRLVFYTQAPQITETEPEKEFKGSASSADMMYYRPDSPPMGDPGGAAPSFRFSNDSEDSKINHEDLVWISILY